ncbi:MAG: lactamase [Dehalococcoidaceae bacterium]|nr:lactamase [Dehalococcoidaceae bacterium]
MEIKVLGAHNTESATTRLSGLVIDGKLALDAGSLTSSLAITEQLELRAVLLTHRHYDHLRDIPALGMTRYLNRKPLPVYALQDTLDALSVCLLNGEVYPRFTQRPPENPALVFIPVSPGVEFQIGPYRVLPVAMAHSAPSTGYLVTGEAGASVFYTGDTGSGFAEMITGIRPGLIITELTTPDRYGDDDWSTKHLTPAFLEAELGILKAAWGCLPAVVCVHMYAALEQEIRRELEQVAARLDGDIRPAFEGMVITL